MEISEQKIDNKTILSLKGRLDASSAKELKDKVSDLAKEGNTFLVVDMGHADFIDSSGLGSLVSCLRSVSRLGGDIRICSLKDSVRAVFELTRLHLIFEIFDNSDDALKSI
ncbi:MAG: STAS domain-containing protein [Deltaproteobacteria bacterium]|nr:STAS domain-containing protein [Deltaproteobacteria bacterium]